jgi:Holliday junction resolvase RusA-like endonuclease
MKPPMPQSTEISIDLPEPLSVNATRRVDWRNHAKVKAWLKQADAQFLMQKRGLAGRSIAGRYEITITLRDGSQKDADNCAKLAIDAMRRFRLVPDDSPEFMRRVTIEFGDVAGCRVAIRPFT